MDAQVGGRPILLHRGENMLHRVSTSTSSRHRASPPCVSLRGNLLRNLPHDSSLSLSLSLAAASPCAFVRPSVYPLYMCLWLAALCFARQASCFFSPAPLLPFSLYHSFSLSLSRSSFFPLQNFSRFYGARSSDSRTLVRTYRRTPVRDTDRRGLTSTHPPPPPTPLSGVFDLNPGQWERRGRGTVPSTTVPYGRL